MRSASGTENVTFENNCVVVKETASAWFEFKPMSLLSVPVTLKSVAGDAMDESRKRTDNSLLINLITLSKASLV